MGVTKDLGWSVVESIDEQTGLPQDKLGHLLDPTNQNTGGMEEGWDVPGACLLNLTNPYGVLEYAVGNEDDFFCYDFTVVTHNKKRWVILHSTINSETGGFIEDNDYAVISREDVPAVLNKAVEMISDGIDWCDRGDPIIHDKKGWNQEEWCFVRSIALYLCPPPFKVTERMRKFGSKKVDQWIKTLRGWK